MPEFDAHELEEFILDKMSKTKLPGLSISVIAEGEAIYSRGFGFRDVESGLHATPNTLYCIGSVTKSFTALAIMQLVDRGLLSLEDPVSKYLPLKLEPKGEPVKVWHLLTHSSGIPALAYAEALIRSIVGDDGTWIPIASYDDMASFLLGADRWAVARPGEKFFYLNEGYVLLGYIVEKISGEKYEDYVKKHLLEPLEMGRSCFSREEFEREADRAVPYVIDREGRRIRSTYPFGITADGGLISCASELSNYVKMLLGRGRFGEAQVVSRESLEEMEKPRLPVPFTLMGGEAYGFGWIVTPSFFGYKLVGHSGSVLTSTAYVGYLPEKGIGVAVLANASGYPLSYIGTYALALLLGRDPDRELPFVKFDRILDELTGTYNAYKNMVRAEVVRRGDLLYLEMKGKLTELVVPLVPEKVDEEESVFYTIRAGSKVEATFTRKDGEIELLFERYKFVKSG